MAKLNAGRSKARLSRKIWVRVFSRSPVSCGTRVLGARRGGAGRSPAMICRRGGGKSVPTHVQ